MAPAATGVQSGMPPAVTLAEACPAAAASPVLPPRLAYAHREPYAACFERLAHHADAAAGLRRLLTHVDADLDGDERLALYHALWHAARRLPKARRDAVGGALDGRHAPLLAALDRDWQDPLLALHLVEHTTPAARAAFVPALGRHHGWDARAPATPLPPALMLHAVRAELDKWPERPGAARIGALQASILAAAEAEAERLPDAMALLFDLALLARDELTATAVMAELLHHGQGRLLRAEGVRAWLDGSAFTDEATVTLQLAPAWQRQWLQPARWGCLRTLATVQAALRRPAPRRRLRQLADQLQALGEPKLATAPPPAEPLRLLTALDQACALIEDGGDAVPALRSLLVPEMLAPAAIAAVWQASADWHAARGDLEGELLALTQARRRLADAALRTRLAARLAAAGAPPAPAFGADWRDEQPYWQALAGHADPMLQGLALRQLAQRATDGQLEPRAPRRQQDLAEAHAHWQRLAGHDTHADAARQALRDPLQTVCRPALQQAHGEDFLWFETPGAQAVTVVFSCIATQHGFAEVGTLRGRLPGQHLMFVRCPDRNWYSDGSYERVHALLQAQVAARFAREQVTCWYGSMGGHGALKMALAFGWRAIVFNPQTDLDLWAAFRPRERAQLWGAERHARLADVPTAAWERCPVYYACGAHTADREALSVAIDRWRQCRHLDLIVEKFDDRNHAGLMARIGSGSVPATLQRIGQRLRCLQGSGAPDSTPLTAAAQSAFWDELDAARSAKVEVSMRDGRLWWQPSLASGTRSP